MKIVKRTSNDFSLSFIYLNSFTKTKYHNHNEKKLQWVYLINGDCDIKYIMNGFEGEYHLSSDVLADLRPVTDLELLWQTSKSICECVGFTSNNSDDCYEAEVLSILSEGKKLKFDKETILVFLSNNIYVNQKEIAYRSVIRLPAEQEIVCKSNHSEGTLLIFYKNNE